MQNSHYYSVFFAPRGRDRIYDLGMHIAQMYLSPFDKLIGIIGEAGSGKSMLIKKNLMNFIYYLVYYHIKMVLVIIL